MTVLLDRVGVSTATPLESFTTSLAPLWNISGAATTVFVRTGYGLGNSTLSVATSLPQNGIDVANVNGFARDDYVVIDDGVAGFEEYARIQTVQAQPLPSTAGRLWFGTTGTGAPSYLPSLRFVHGATASVREVTLATKVLTTDYTLNANTGTITEVTEFGNGNVVLANYTTDFIMPATYPTALNDSGDLDESWGKWAGKSIVDGTYTLSIWSSLTLPLVLFGETNSYRSASNVTPANFLVGSATDVEAYAKISSGDNCYKCHQDVEFHGAGRRSFDACVICHGTAGSEDRPQLTAANAPLTDETTINFRTMLHKIHMGEELTNASTYTIVGFGSGAYPNNFGLSTFEEIVFPAMPGGVRNCAKCHGDTNDSWKEPVHRDHPTQQATPTARWAVVCAACHDSTDAVAHITVQTAPGGLESCAVCHGTGAEWSVERMHKSY
jgi:OmcA/MtrC family decaheme c-type cytochrome